MQPNRFDAYNNVILLGRHLIDRAAWWLKNYKWAEEHSEEANRRAPARQEVFELIRPESDKRVTVTRMVQPDGYENQHLHDEYWARLGQHAAQKADVLEASIQFERAVRIWDVRGEVDFLPLAQMRMARSNRTALRILEERVLPWAVDLVRRAEEEKERAASIPTVEVRVLEPHKLPSPPQWLMPPASLAELGRRIKLSPHKAKDHLKKYGLRKYEEARRQDWTVDLSSMDPELRRKIETPSDSPEVLKTRNKSEKK